MTGPGQPDPRNGAEQSAPTAEVAPAAAHSQLQPEPVAPNLNGAPLPRMIGAPNDNLSLNWYLPMRGMVIENLVLCALSHWTLREPNDCVVELMERNFRQDELFNASVELSLVCKLAPPARRTCSSKRTAAKAQAEDLLDMVTKMGDADKLPTFVICSEDLHRVAPLLGAPGGREERGLAARVEALEISQKIHQSEMKRLITAKSFSEVTKAQTAGGSQSVFAPQQIIVTEPPNGSRDMSKVTTSLVRNDAEDRYRRDRSNSVKRRKVGDNIVKTDSDWITVPKRKQRNTNVGSAKVDCDLGGVSLSAPKDFWLGGINPRLEENKIVEILKKCATNIDKQSDFDVLDICCLTKDAAARSKSFKVTVDSKHAGQMLNSAMFPEGWHHRPFTANKSFFKRGFNNGEQGNGQEIQLNLLP